MCLSRLGVRQNPWSDERPVGPRPSIVLSTRELQTETVAMVGAAVRTWKSLPPQCGGLLGEVLQRHLLQMAGNSIRHVRMLLDTCELLQHRLSQGSHAATRNSAPGISLRAGVITVKSNASGLPAFQPSTSRSAGLRLGEEGSACSLSVVYPAAISIAWIVSRSTLW